MSINSMIEHALNEFDSEYEVIIATLKDGIIDGNARYEALAELNEAAKTLIETIKDAADKAPTSLDEVIVQARSKFAVSYIMLFIKNNLEDELDYLIPEQDLDYGTRTPSYNYFEIA